jgi:Peptidase S46
LQKMSTPEKNYVHDGFYARTRGEEIKSPDLELNILVSMEDVTARVQGVVTKQMSDAEALKARKAEIAKIQKASLDATGLRSDVVSLYGGGEYWLYRYKKYTDVRLVFAPEQQIAFFGGDADNFTYPRYCLDMALFRVYENGSPVESKRYLKWNPAGIDAGELVFVSGHPGSTERLKTVAELEAQRDHRLPMTTRILNRRLNVLKQYGARGSEQARQAANQIFSIENALKAFKGEHDGLLNKELMEKKRKEEAEFRALVSKSRELESRYGSAWEELRLAQKHDLERAKETLFRTLRGARLPSMALTIVLYVDEVQKPDGERLDGFHESQLESLRFRLLSPAPLYPELEIALLTDSLQESLEQLGLDDAFVKAALQGRAPVEVAREVIAGTKLTDPAFRKKLVEEGKAAVAGSKDPAIELARRVEPAVREIRKWHETKVESLTTSAGEKLGKARFAVYGRSIYPEATFTLRLTFGTVKGYPMNGTMAPPKTTFFGLYDRAGSFGLKPPFNLPDRYGEKRDKLDLSTSFNFVSTADIIGGNSGSPVINRAGEIVGLIFDGNIESLVGNYIYYEETNRAIAVHTAGMTEVLKKLYGADALVNELAGESRQAAP